MTLQQVLANPTAARVAMIATGGGAPGICLLAGYCKALWMAGIRPAAWSGTSAGAVTGHILSKDTDVDRLIDVLQNLPPDAVVSPRAGGWLVFLPFHDHLYDNDKARALLSANGPAVWGEEQFELRMWSSLMTTGYATAHQLSLADFDDPADAALASMSVPFLFPAMLDKMGGLHQDGGIVFNAPIVPEWFDQFDHVFLLVAQGQGKQEHMDAVPAKIAEGLYLLRSLMHAQMDRAVEIMAAHANATTLWIDKSDDTGVLTFNPGLIFDAYQYAAAALAVGKS